MIRGQLTLGNAIPGTDSVEPIRQNTCIKTARTSYRKKKGGNPINRTAQLNRRNLINQPNQPNQINRIHRIDPLNQTTITPDQQPCLNLATPVILPRLDQISTSMQ